MPSPHVLLGVAGKIQYPHPSSPHFGKNSFDIEDQPEKRRFLERRVSPLSKKHCFFAGARMYMERFPFFIKKSCFFGRFERFGAILGILGETAETIVGTPLECKPGKKTEDHPS